MRAAWQGAEGLAIENLIADVLSIKTDIEPSERTSDITRRPSCTEPQVNSPTEPSITSVAARNELVKSGQ